MGTHTGPAPHWVEAGGIALWEHTLDQHTLGGGTLYPWFPSHCGRSLFDFQDSSLLLREHNTKYQAINSSVREVMNSSSMYKRTLVCVCMRERP